MSDEQPMIEAVIEDIITSHRCIMRAIGSKESSVWMDLDLSMAQLKTLMTLYHGGALPIGQIAEQLNIGQPTASHLVDRLVQTQLVSRTEDPQDRRRTLAQLSPRGEELVARINQMRFGLLRRCLTQLSPEDLATFQRISRILADTATSETVPIPENS